MRKKGKPPALIYVIYRDTCSLQLSQTSRKILVFIWEMFMFHCLFLNKNEDLYTNLKYYIA